MAADANNAEWRGGYYWDWFAQRWVERPAAATQRLPRRSLSRRAVLQVLIEEIESADSETKLYASLLARCLIGQNMSLMADFGERIAKLSKDEKRRVA